jgi:DNA-binding SARP family transcriptional activator/TolB-like protein
MAKLRLLILGGFRLVDERGRELGIGSRKARAVLALAAFAGPSGMARERIAGMLWRDSEEARARQSLRQTLSDLRRDAGPVLVASADRLRLDGDLCSADAVEFALLAQQTGVDALERASDLYAGPLLDGLAVGDGGFDGWLEIERQRLAARNRGVLARLAALHAQAGDTAACVRIAERTLGVDPGDEAAWQDLIRAHCAAGQPQLALRAFERCRDALTRELDATPAAQTLALADRARLEIAAPFASAASRLTADPDPNRVAAPRPDAAPPAGLPAGVQAPDSSRASPGESVPAIVVMDFEASRGALADRAGSLSRGLAARLARLPGIAVVEGRYVFGDVDPGGAEGRRIIRERGIACLITGALEATADGAQRMAVQLVEGDGGRLLWSRRFEVAAGRSAADDDELLAAVVGLLERQLAATRFDAPGADEGWRGVRAAMAALFARGWSEEAVRLAVQRYRAAIQANPELALAHAQKSLVLALASKMGLVDGEPALLEAREAAERAIALAPADSDVLGYAGCAIADLGDPRRGEPLLERAVEENPDNPQAWAALGACRLGLARIEEGLQSLERGLRVSPWDYRRAVWLTLRSRGLLSLRRVDDAIEAARAAARSDAHFYPAWIALAAAQFKAGRRTEASRALGEALRIRPRLRVEEAHPWIGPRMAARLSEVWPSRPEPDPRAPRAGPRPDAGR